MSSDPRRQSRFSSTLYTSPKGLTFFHQVSDPRFSLSSLGSTNRYKACNSSFQVLPSWVETEPSGHRGRGRYHGPGGVPECDLLNHHLPPCVIRESSTRVGKGRRSVDHDSPTEFHPHLQTFTDDCRRVEYTERVAGRVKRRLRTQPSGRQPTRGVPTNPRSTLTQGTNPPARGDRSTANPGRPQPEHTVEVWVGRERGARGSESGRRQSLHHLLTSAGHVRRENVSFRDSVDLSEPRGPVVPPSHPLTPTVFHFRSASLH